MMTEEEQHLWHTDGLLHERVVCACRKPLIERDKQVWVTCDWHNNDLDEVDARCEIGLEELVARLVSGAHHKGPVQLEASHVPHRGLGQRAVAGRRRWWRHHTVVPDRIV